MYSGLTRHKSLLHSLPESLKPKGKRATAELTYPSTMATVFANEDFDAEKAAEDLKAAMKGFGTSEEDIIAVLDKHNNAQRQIIAETFKTCYGQELEDELKSELGGHFEDVVVGLLLAPRVYDATQLYKGMKGAGTDEKVLIEILCSRSPEEIAEIKEQYEIVSEGDKLDEDVEGNTSGHFKAFLRSQVTCGRDEGDDVDEDLAREDAEKVYNAGEGKFGTDESEFNKVLCTRNYRQLNATFDAYRGAYDCDIEDAIKSEVSGDLEDGYLAIVKYTRDPVSYFAERLYKSMKGLGTDDKTLIRVIISRSERDLADIKVAFKDMYGTTLSKMIRGDTGGDYKKMLLAIVGHEEEDDD